MYCWGTFAGVRDARKISRRNRRRLVAVYGRLRNRRETLGGRVRNFARQSIFMLRAEAAARRNQNRPALEKLRVTERK